MGERESTVSQPEARVLSVLSGAASDDDAARTALRELLDFDPGRAAELASALLERGLLIPAAHHALATADARAGRWQSAMDHARAGLERDPGDVQLLKTFAGIAAQQKSWGEAVDAAQAAMDAGGRDDPWLLYLQGGALVAQDRASAGVPVLKRALEIDPELPHIRRLIFEARMARWSPVVALVALACGVGAAMDAGLVGLTALGLSVSILGYYSYVHAKSGHWTRAVLLLAYAAAFVAGHWFFAPHAWG